MDTPRPSTHPLTQAIRMALTLERHPAWPAERARHGFAP